MNNTKYINSIFIRFPQGANTLSWTLPGGEMTNLIWKLLWTDLKMIFSSDMLQQQVSKIICMSFSCVARFCLFGILFEDQRKYFCYMGLKDFSQRGRKMAGLGSGQRWEKITTKNEVCVPIPLYFPKTAPLSIHTHTTNAHL